MKIQYLTLGFTFILLSLLSSVVVAGDKPNVILVMCDDLGFGDVGFNGGTHIRTPHLDEMAANSLRLTRFYAQAPVCSPTRASVVTGRHHDRTGIYTANNGHLRDGEYTIYEALASKGYMTGHFGKWHMGTLTRKIVEANRGAKAKEHFSPPWNHSVNTTFATEAKTPTYDPMWKPAKGTKGDFRAVSKAGWHAIPQGADRARYGTHYWTGEETMVDPESESLLGDDSAIIMNQAMKFIDLNRDGPFGIVVWFHAPHLPCVASAADVASYDNGKTTGFQQNYYGCVTALDREMGKLRAQLRELKIADNTIITFCSDNGPEGSAKAPGKQGLYRGRKRSLYEGGVRVPSLIEWPAKIKAGSASDVATCTVDYFPTLMEIVGFEMPDNRDIDGTSLVPLLEGSMKARPKPLGFHIKNQAAWHDGDLKIYCKNIKSAQWELYNLASDRRRKIIWPLASLKRLRDWLLRGVNGRRQSMLVIREAIIDLSYKNGPLHIGYRLATNERALAVVRDF